MTDYIWKKRTNFVLKRHCLIIDLRQAVLSLLSMIDDVGKR